MQLPIILLPIPPTSSAPSLHVGLGLPLSCPLNEAGLPFLSLAGLHDSLPLCQTLPCSAAPLPPEGVCTGAHPVPARFRTHHLRGLFSVQCVCVGGLLLPQGHTQWDVPGGTQLILTTALGKKQTWPLFLSLEENCVHACMCMCTRIQSIECETAALRRHGAPSAEGPHAGSWPPGPRICSDTKPPATLSPACPGAKQCW